MQALKMRDVAVDFAEDIRLVIWDLDETFWHGTLTEGGIRYRQDTHDLVIDLARRGIMSSICSKNDLHEVEAVLRARGIWEYFIFPSVDWTPKGERIAAMLDQIGLRAQSVLFLDDNATNLAQAAYQNPGLNIGLPALIPELRQAPQCAGKPDPACTRLAQYKVKERKSTAIQRSGSDVFTFLRQSGVEVMLDYDVDAHLDRAIELINRTNQLNFTKERLPEARDAARTALGALLARNTTDAALIRVKDRFGDYGQVGFYLTERVNNIRRLRHFCFSCRTLNMYVEHWTYAHLGRPPLRVVGDVLSNPMDPDMTVDWITPGLSGGTADKPVSALWRTDSIIARGGCDLASLMHYFNLHTKAMTEEFNAPKNGQMFRRDHSAFLMPALGGGLGASQVRAAAKLGYAEEDFSSALGAPLDDAAIVFLSFWADADIPLYRHRETGLEVPYWLVGAQHHDLIANTDLGDSLAQTDIQRGRLGILRQEFEHLGLLSEDQMAHRYAEVLDRIEGGRRTVLVLANECGPRFFSEPGSPRHPHHQRLNRVLRRLAARDPAILLLDPADHISGSADLIDLNHFKRPVYHRMYRDALFRLQCDAPGEGRDV